MITWPDLVVAAFALLFVLKGWKRGFVAEIGGFVALACAVWAALLYRGSLDDLVERTLHLGPGSAHVVGMAAFAVFVYVVLMVLSSVLSRIAKLPVIGIGNSVGGALIGVLKVLLVTWAVVYVVLFFPIPRDLRTDLRHSTVIAALSEHNGQVDGMVKNALPWFVKPFAEPLFARHRS
ncbi:MAG TPA: CvpA family protein [Candidatus Sulfotelmatobacter sp.]|nr:CvpA family protein [Candidatus Sulfotelmatobacter sp.]